MRRRRVFLLFLCLFTLLIAGGYLILIYTGASRSLVESALSRLIRSPFGMGDAGLDPTSGKVHIEEFQIGHPSIDETDILRADRIELEVSTNPLGSDDVGTVRRVKIDKLHLNLSLLESEQWALGEILELPETAAAETEVYPAILITDSRITVRLTEDRPAVDFTSVHLELVPETPDSSHMVLTGSMLTPNGFEVLIDGTGDMAKGEFRALFETSFDLLPGVARTYSPEAETYLTDIGLSGEARKVSFWMQYPPEADDDNPVSARLQAEVDGVGWTFREFPYPIANATGTITASTREGGRIHFDLLATKNEQQIRTRGDLTECLSGSPLFNVQVDARQVPIDDELAHAMTAVPEALAAWDAFEPSGGTGNARVQLYNETPGGELLVALDIEPQGVAARFRGFPTDDESGPVRFPYLIENTTGTIQVRPHTVSISDVRGSRPDGGQVTVNGELEDFRTGAPAELWLEIAGTEMTFSNELRVALEELLEGGAAIYDTYSPSGSGDVMVVVQKQPSQEEPTFLIEISPRGCSASYDLFPYQLDDLTGSIRISGTGVAFELQGSRDRSRVDLGGRFLLGSTETGLLAELWFDGSSVPLDAELRRAMQVMNPELDWFWDEFDPEGTVDCGLTLWRAASDEDFQYDVRLDFQEGSAAIRRFGRRLHELRGNAFVHGSRGRNRMDVSVLRGEVDNGDAREPAGVVLEGVLEAANGEAELDLTTIVRGLDVNESLAKTLHHADIISTETWAVLRPSGLVDVVALHSKSPDSDIVSHDLRVQLRDVSSEAPFLPRPVTELRGEVRIREDRGTFDEIRGKLGDAVAICEEGFFVHAGGHTLVEATLTAEELVVDSRFSNLMSGPMKTAYEERNVRGTLNIAGLKMRYTLPDDGDEFDMVFYGPVTAKNISMVLATPVHEISGVFEFSHGRVTPSGGDLQCVAENVSFRVLGHQCTSFGGTFDATHEEIRLSDLDMELHGGRVTAGEGERAMTYDLASEALDLQLQWDEMSLTSFIRASGQPSPISRGTLSGSLALQLPGTDFIDLEATGQLQIANGKLGEVPIFTSIYAYLNPAKRPQFDAASLDLRVENQQAVIENLVLTSPLIEVTGEGTVGFDGYLDIVLEFPNFFGSAGDWLILPGLVRALTTQVVRFHMYGYMRSPKARPRWLFQDSPGRRPIEPIPARIPMPPRKRF